MMRIFRVELSLLAWALLFVAVGFYLMGRSAHAAEVMGKSNPAPTAVKSMITHAD